jgi:DNA-binding XRE family transcriptional regulator
MDLSKSEEIPRRRKRSRKLQEKISSIRQQCFAHAIGLELRCQRERLALTQKQVAEKAGVSRSLVSALENGRRVKMTLMQFFLYCDTWGAPADRILLAGMRPGTGHSASNETYTPLLGN